MRHALSFAEPHAGSPEDDIHATETFPGADHRLLKHKEEVAYAKKMEKAWKELLSRVKKQPYARMRFQERVGAKPRSSRLKREVVLMSNILGEMEQIKSRVIELQCEIDGHRANGITGNCSEELQGIEQKVGEPLKQFLQSVESLRRLFQALLLPREKLIEHNQRLVLFIANKMLKRRDGCGDVTIRDSMQEGQLGLIRATDGFDYRKAKFCTYATWWIRQAIQNALPSNKMGMRPRAGSAQMRRLRKYRAEFFQREGRPASMEEIADGMACSHATVQKILQARQSPLSLDEAGEHDDCFGDIIADRNTPEPPDAVELLEKKEIVSSLLRHLHQRHRQVIDLRFGLSNGVPKTLEEISDIVGITKERIRQIEKKALAKLRDCGAAYLLSGSSSVATARSAHGAQRGGHPEHGDPGIPPASCTAGTRVFA